MKKVFYFVGTELVSGKYKRTVVVHDTIENALERYKFWKEYVKYEDITPVTEGWVPE